MHVVSKMSARAASIVTLFVLLNVILAANADYYDYWSYCEVTTVVFDKVVYEVPLADLVVDRRNRVPSAFIRPVWQLSVWSPEVLPSYSGESHAGEGGINIVHHIGFPRARLVFPAGKLGLSSLYLFTYNFFFGEWTNVSVPCKPVGVAYCDHSGEIVGFCAVDPTMGESRCVQSFKVRGYIQSQGKWLYVSELGSCSHELLTTSLTNPIILKYNGDQYHTVVKLYFTELHTNRLHVMDLVQKKSELHIIPMNSGDGALRIFPEVSDDFIGIRIESSIGDTGKIDQILFSSTTQRFTKKFFPTMTTAFSSYRLDYLVSYDNDHKEIIISRDNRTKQRIKIFSTLDGPFKCKNVARPDYHYLLCLGQHGRAVHLLNITQNALLKEEIVHANNAAIVHIGTVGDTLYLTNQQKEILFYSIASSTFTRIGTLVNDTAGIRIVNSTRNYGCNRYDMQYVYRQALFGEVIVINSEDDEAIVINREAVVINSEENGIPSDIIPFSYREDSKYAGHTLGILVGSAVVVVMVTFVIALIVFIVYCCRHINAAKSTSSVNSVSDIAMSSICSIHTASIDSVVTDSIHGLSTDSTNSLPTVSDGSIHGLNAGSTDSKINLSTVSGTITVSSIHGFRIASSISTASSTNLSQPTAEEQPVQDHGPIKPRDAPLPLVTICGDSAPINKQCCTSEEPEEFVEDVKIRGAVSCSSPPRPLSSVTTTSAEESYSK